jgi:23S rRNA (cytosine1962-C5)-methyltransferase
MKNMKSFTEQLENAWNQRAHTGVERVFHGPGEGIGALENVVIDGFSGHFWVTWKGPANSGAQSAIETFLREKSAESAVVQVKTGDDIAGLPVPLLGEPPESFVCIENGLRLKIRFRDSRHPGLFLDHEPLRSWLKKNSRGLSVLNTFCYTGSLSVAALAGGAISITNLDLAKPAIEWSRENLKLNSSDESDWDLIAGDVFEWLPRFKKKNRKFGIVIADPPSSSRGKKGHFSTKKDLDRLAGLAMDLVEPGGYLILSINSQNVSWDDFLESIEMAKNSAQFVGREILRLTLPAKSFPVKHSDQAYLKGIILQKNT